MVTIVLNSSDKMSTTFTLDLYDSLNRFDMSPPLYPYRFTFQLC